MDVCAVLSNLFSLLSGKWEPGVDPVKAEMASHYWYVSSANANRDLGFKPRSPSETITDTIRWIVENRGWLCVVVWCVVSLCVV
jgi:nucleoside-diphosphate-sugar epimerase